MFLNLCSVTVITNIAFVIRVDVFSVIRGTFLHFLIVLVCKIHRLFLGLNHLRVADLWGLPFLGDLRLFKFLLGLCRACLVLALPMIRLLLYPDLILGVHSCIDFTNIISCTVLPRVFILEI